MIIGDNHFIKNKILNSAIIADAVPALRTFSENIRALAAACNTCSGDKESVQKLDKTWNDLREFLANLSEDRKEIIRLHAGGGQRIRVSYKTGSGKNTSYKHGDI